MQVGSALGTDPRMHLMQKTWFDNKDVIDIGCNEGVFTISLGNLSSLNFKVPSMNITRRMIAVLTCFQRFLRQISVYSNGILTSS